MAKEIYHGDLLAGYGPRRYKPQTKHGDKMIVTSRLHAVRSSYEWGLAKGFQHWYHWCKSCYCIHYYNLQLLYLLLIQEYCFYKLWPICSLNGLHWLRALNSVKVGWLVRPRLQTM